MNNERPALSLSLRHGCQMAKFDPLGCARVEGVGAQSKERKGSNFAAQRSGAIVQKPEWPNTYDSKNLAIAIWQPCSAFPSFLLMAHSTRGETKDLTNGVFEAIWNFAERKE